MEWGKDWYLLYQGALLLTQADTKHTHPRSLPLAFAIEEIQSVAMSLL